MNYQNKIKWLNLLPPENAVRTLVSLLEQVKCPFKLESLSVQGMTNNIP